MPTRVIGVASVDLERFVLLCAGIVVVVAIVVLLSDLIDLVGYTLCCLLIVELDLVVFITELVVGVVYFRHRLRYFGSHRGGHFGRRCREILWVLRAGRRGVGRRYIARLQSHGAISAHGHPGTRVRIAYARLNAGLRWVKSLTDFAGLLLCLRLRLPFCTTHTTHRPACPVSTSGPSPLSNAFSTQQCISLSRSSFPSR